MPALVSVVIPTAARPALVATAVDSALAGMPAGTVEVLVVPNGPDRSWEQSLSYYRGHRSVRIIPVSQGNANLARNVGLEAATGQLIRFLDDDDYLLPDGCHAQYDAMVNAGADVCSAAVRVLDLSGRIDRTTPQPSMDDLACATLVPTRLTLPTAHVFRRAAIVNLRWDPLLKYRQDTQWMMQLCGSRELKWLRIDQPVGVWREHGGPRVSTSTGLGNMAKVTANMILALVNDLRDQGRLTPARRCAAADGLWSCVHRGILYNPLYWRAIAHAAHELAEHRYPPTPIYQNRLIRRFNPYIVEAGLVPLRWLSTALRKAAAP